MKSANPFSDYDLLPYGEKKAQDGITIPKPDNRPQAKADVSKSINLNLRRSNAHETIHELLNKTPEEQRFNWNEILVGGMAALDAIIPQDKIEEPVVYPLQAYNQGQYGRGSHAIAKNGKKIDPPTKKLSTDPQQGWTNAQAIAAANQPKPNYNFIGVPTGLSPQIDSISYRYNFNSLLENNPYALKSYNDFKKYGMSADWEPKVWADAHNDLNAYRDAEAQRYKPVVAALSVRPEVSKKPMASGGIIPGINGTMYSRNAYKVKNKITNPMLMPYGGTIGGEDPTVKSKPASPARTLIPGQTVIKNEDEAFKVNAWIGNFEERHGGPGNAVGVRRVGDQIPKFVGDVPYTPTKKQTTLPYGVTINDVLNTSEGYGYYHPQEGTFIPVDSSVFQRYKKPAGMKYGGKISKKGKKADMGTMIPYFEEGASYNLTDDQVRDLIAQGYEIEM